MAWPRILSAKAVRLTERLLWTMHSRVAPTVWQAASQGADFDETHPPRLIGPRIR